LNSFIELKQIIDSMESRIEDDAVDTFQRQLSIMEEKYTGKAAIPTVIKILQSIGRYLGSKKEMADEDALPTAKSIVLALEKLVIDPDLCGPDSDKEQIDIILSESIEKYNSLKNKIAFQPLVTDTEMQDLKAVILAVDWEISDITLKTFDTVTNRILTRLKPHKIHHAFLRIIHSMGKYIASKQATAHKDSILFLHSVFKNFEQIVQTPDMPFPEKKQLIKNDIDAFHNFKKKITSLTAETQTPADQMEDEIIQPALSHVKTSKKAAAQDVIPLSPLSSEEDSFTDQPGDSENIVPALAGKKKVQPAPRDIMDDLFSGKESPADELLDAIHLANIQGPDQKRAMNMDEPTKEELQREGIKNFTPQRMENKPIPEIGNRLDEFFNLDIAEDSIVTAVNEDDYLHESLSSHEESVQDDGPLEAIVPIHEEDSFDENADIDNLEGNDPAQAALNRLKLLAKSHDKILNEESFTVLDKDISHLKLLWQEDLDKVMLLDLISRLIMKNKPDHVASDEETVLSTPEQSDKPSLGFWEKLKMRFTKK